MGICKHTRHWRARSSKSCIGLSPPSCVTSPTGSSLPACGNVRRASNAAMRSRRSPGALAPLTGGLAKGTPPPPHSSGQECAKSPLTSTDVHSTPYFVVASHQGTLIHWILLDSVLVLSRRSGRELAWQLLSPLIAASNLALPEG